MSKFHKNISLPNEQRPKSVFLHILLEVPGTQKYTTSFKYVKSKYEFSMVQQLVFCT
jgi:hypothetical protein